MGDQSSSEDFMSGSSAPQTWPDGWYVYANGELGGPFSAAETFHRRAETAAGKPLLVSRKGFSQWYPLQDLAEIYKAGKSTSPEPARSQPKVMARRVGLHANPAQSLARAAAQPARPVTPLAPVSSGSKSALEPAAVSAAQVPKGLAKQAVLQEYFLARSRLRLGRLRNPWITGLLSAPLSLLVYWPVWYGTVQQEMALHTLGSKQKEAKVNRRPALLAAVPFMHIIMAYRLAQQVRSMELQNKYEYTSPGLAAAFALFPPLAMIYLQRALNRHWLLHAKHLVVKRRAQAA